MMRFNNIQLIIGSSTIALIALFAFQVRWLVQAKDLIETNFDQKVRMALCYAVESLGVDVEENTEAIASPPLNFNSLSVCSSGLDNASILEDLSQGITEDLVFQQSLSDALSFYGIELDFEAYVLDNATSTQSCTKGENATYCCSLSMLEIGGASQMLNIRFPEKTEYVLGQMGFMLSSSILILLFISVVFILANYTLIRQKRISEMNIDFFNNMAHEFRTPLTNISLANKLLVKNRQELEGNRYLEVVKRENRKLLQQVERVLDLAKLENGEYHLQKNDLCLRALIQEVLTDMEMQLKAKNAEIKLNIGGGDWKINGDALHLSNAFRNLIDNALKYSEGDLTLEVGLREVSNKMIVSFKDNGAGIAKSEQEYIFDKFSRVGYGDTHNQKGFGLGLSYVKMIVEKHNGWVEVISDLKRGCRFDLVLPK